MSREIGGSLPSEKGSGKQGSCSLFIRFIGFAEMPVEGAAADAQNGGGTPFVSADSLQHVVDVPRIRFRQGREVVVVEYVVRNLRFCLGSRAGRME